jgi:hypothetical protein
MLTITSLMSPLKAPVFISDFNLANKLSSYFLSVVADKKFLISFLIVTSISFFI